MCAAGFPRRMSRVWLSTSVILPAARLLDFRPGVDCHRLHGHFSQVARNDGAIVPFKNCSHNGNVLHHSFPNLMVPWTLTTVASCLGPPILERSYSRLLLQRNDQPLRRAPDETIGRNAARSSLSEEVSRNVWTHERLGSFSPLLSIEVLFSACLRCESSCGRHGTTS